MFSFVLTIVVSALLTFSSGQTYLRADTSKGTYELIDSVLGKGTVEDPDCSHKSFGRHITQQVDPILNRAVFLFHIHVKPDNDRCSKFDRQRNEIKTYGPSSENLKGYRGETVSLSWNFWLDADFQPSKAFSHIHQIKDYGGSIGSPMMSFGPRFKSKGNILELIHVDYKGKKIVVKVTELKPFLGHWIHVKESLTYDTRGKFSVVFSNLQTGKVLLEYRNTNIDLWRTGATFVRPKWGIYRGLSDSSRLRDEIVKFDTFCLGKGSKICN